MGCLPTETLLGGNAGYFRLTAGGAGLYMLITARLCCCPEPGSWQPCRPPAFQPHQPVVGFSIGAKASSDGRDAFDRGQYLGTVINRGRPPAGAVGLYRLRFRQAHANWGMNGGSKSNGSDK